MKINYMHTIINKESEQEILVTDNIEQKMSKVIKQDHSGLVKPIDQSDQKHAFLRTKLKDTRETPRKQFKIKETLTKSQFWHKKTNSLEFLKHEQKKKYTEYVNNKQ